MKKLKYPIFVSLIVLLISITVIPTSAAIEPYYPGDIDHVGGVTVKDATLIQKSVASLTTLNKKQMYSADVDFDDEVTVKDATLIQKYVAELITDFDKDPLYFDLRLMSFYADYNSGKAMVSEPITFTAIAEGLHAPFTYEFIIDNEVVQSKSSDSSLTHTFEKRGSYYVEVNVYDAYDNVQSDVIYYQVENPYTVDSVYITQLVCTPTRPQSHDTVTLLANAIGGSGKYEYQFKLDDGTILQEYSEAQSYTFDSTLKHGEYTVFLDVIDKNNPNLVTSKHITFEVADLLG